MSEICLLSFKMVVQFWQVWFQLITENALTNRTNSIFVFTKLVSWIVFHRDTESKYLRGRKHNLPSWKNESRDKAWLNELNANKFNALGFHYQVQRAISHALPKRNQTIRKTTLRCVQKKFVFHLKIYKWTSHVKEKLMI